MKRAISAVFSGLALMSCAAVPPAGAADKPNILVMGEDAKEPGGSGMQIIVVPRDNRVFKQVLEAVSDQLNLEGFDVYDERVVTLDDFKQDRHGRTDDELFDIARSVKHPPIDTVVVFTVYAGTRKLSYANNVYTRIAGRALNAKTGLKLASFEVTSPREWMAAPDCERDCLLEVIGRNAKALADDLGAVLARRLVMAYYDNREPVAAAGPGASAMPTAYALVFGGFTPEDISGVEEYLAAFGGYKGHRPVRSSMRHNEYWYETTSDSARMNRNLRLMLERLGAEGRVTFSGNTFTVEKIAHRKAR